MYVPALPRRPLGADTIVPTVSPTPWVLGAAALVALVYFTRRKRRA